MQRTIGRVISKPTYKKLLENLVMKFLLDDLNSRLALGVLGKLWWITRIRGLLTVMVYYDLRRSSWVLLKKQTFDLSNENGEGYGALLSAAKLGKKPCHEDISGADQSSGVDHER